SLPDAVRLAEKTLADLNRSLGAAGLDYTLIDGDWIREADLADGVLSANGLAVSALVMPAVRWLDEDVRTKLAQFEAGGGVLLWTAAMPDGIDAALTEDPAALLREKTDTGIRVEASEPGIILISPYEKDGRRFWYLVNNCPQETAVNVSVAGGPPTVWDLLTGEVAESPAFRIPAYSAVIVES
ncbi:MAG: hypothetical protein IKZ41_11845, partial [Clostridia bacterium]|nr:hypothetical protein [Clostridia bacterium]